MAPRGPLWCALYLCSLLVAAEGQRDALVVPLRRKDGGLIARGLLRNATLPLHGAVKDYGYFYATLLLGSPPRSFAVIVDTGSTITYVPCTSCGHNCGPHHKDAAFDPVASSSSSQVVCGTAQCVCGRPACGCSAENECTYSRTYAEQSSSAGVLIEDKLQLGDGGVDVVFGCETKETGEIFNQEADGIMGLGNSEVSIVNQLASAGVIDDVFSLCFGSVEGDGALLLGEVPLSQYNVELEYTALLTSPAYPHYYSVQLLGIMVGTSKLVVPAEKFEEGYGTVLDSGTTFTYLPSEAFKAFKDAVSTFALSKGLKTTKGPDPKFYDICFGGAPHVEHADQLEHVFPHLELQFQGGVNLRMGPLNYLFMHTAEAGAYCLGVFDNGQSGTLLGGITFRNILVEYDRRNKRVGFGTAPCQALGLGQKPCPNGNSDGSSLSSLGAKCSPALVQTPRAAPPLGDLLTDWSAGWSNSVPDVQTLSLYVGITLCVGAAAAFAAILVRQRLNRQRWQSLSAAASRSGDGQQLVTMASGSTFDDAAESLEHGSRGDHALAVLPLEGPSLEPKWPVMPHDGEGKEDTLRLFPVGMPDSSAASTTDWHRK